MLKFKTPRDRNGNTYTLIIDPATLTYKRDINPYNSSDYVRIGKRDREKLINQLEKQGYIMEG